MRFAVYLNTCHAAVSSLGELAAVIQAKPTPVFMGSSAETVEFLRELGIGRSVEVRRYDDDGEWRGSRSCMNKPALWADVAGEA
ncbi:MAG: hypothetical protein AB1698_01485 [Pseudomonadota bacterium]